MKKLFSILVIFSSILLTGCSFTPPSMTNEKIEINENTQIATFAGGCFWCMEPAFQNADGVIDAKVGYSGGEEKNANYTSVSAGNTQHREVIQIEYDPEKISYEELVRIYFEQIDPLDANGQFADRGFQYSPSLYYHDLFQKEEIEEVITFLEKEKFHESLHVDIEKYTTFFPAENYHQDYYIKNEDHYNAYAKGSGRKDFIADEWKNSEELWTKKMNLGTRGKTK